MLGKLEVIEMMSEMSVYMNEGNWELILRSGRKNVRKLDRESRGVTYLMMANAAVQIDQLKKGLTYCRKAARAGHAQADEFRNQILEMKENQ